MCFLLQCSCRHQLDCKVTWCKVVSNPSVRGSEEATKALLDASADAFACPVEGKTLAEVGGAWSGGCVATVLTPNSRLGCVCVSSVWGEGCAGRVTYCPNS
jgi:hypothetical protein